MVLGGLWHGANATFLVWGIWHGLWLALERATGTANRRTSAALVQTQLVVLLGWVAFRAVDMSAATGVYAGMIGLNGWAVPMDAALQISGESLVMLALAVAYCALEPTINRTALRTYFAPAEPQLPGAGGGAVLTATTSLLPVAVISLVGMLAVMKLAEASFSPFLYFQF